MSPDDNAKEEAISGVKDNGNIHINSLINDIFKQNECKQNIPLPPPPIIRPVFPRHITTDTNIEKEIITLSDEKSTLKIPCDPRKISIYSDNVQFDIWKNDISTKCDPQDKIEPLKWIRNIDDFIISGQSTSVHSRMFGDILPRSGPQALYFIPWKCIEDFKYNCDTNPFLEILYPKSRRLSDAIKSILK